MPETPEETRLRLLRTIAALVDVPVETFFAPESSATRHAGDASHALTILDLYAQLSDPSDRERCLALLHDLIERRGLERAVPDDGAAALN